MSKVNALIFAQNPVSFSSMLSDTIIMSGSSFCIAEIASLRALATTTFTSPFSRDFLYFVDNSTRLSIIRIVESILTPPPDYKPETQD